MASWYPYFTENRDLFRDLSNYVDADELEETKYFKLLYK